jgi:hypothetical protein
MNVERETLVHVSAWELIEALKQMYPAVLPLQAMRREGKVSLTASGGSHLLITYKLTEASHTAYGLLPPPDAADDGDVA